MFSHYVKDRNLLAVLLLGFSSGLPLALTSATLQAWFTDAGVNILTLGQYLRPSAEHLPVRDYIHPDMFSRLAQKYETMGFKKVFAGPYVRSSYHAGETYLNAGKNSVRADEI